MISVKEELDKVIDTISSTFSETTLTIQKRTEVRHALYSLYITGFFEGMKANNTVEAENEK